MSNIQLVKKSFFYILLITLLCKICIAKQQFSIGKNPIFSQVRIGLGLAVEYINIDAKLKVDPFGKLGNISSSESQVAKKFQFAPCIELGTNILNNYYMGMHLSYHNSNAKDSSRTPIRATYHFQHTFKLKSYTNIFFKPGVKIAPNIMIYGLIGPSISNWSHVTEQFLVNSRADTTTLKNQFILNKKRQVGLGLGAGCEYIFQKRYALSFDYTYHRYRSVQASQQINYTTQINAYPPRFTTYSGNLVKTIKPSYSTFAVRLTVFF